MRGRGYRRRLAVGLAVAGLGLPFAAPAHAAHPAGPAAGKASAEQRGSFAGRVRIASGRRLYLECRGRGRPTVILEAGLRNRGDIWSTLQVPGQRRPTVFAALARTTRVCAYDRPGTTVGVDVSGRSRSDPVRMPRSTGAAVADLRALLRAARIRAPYVLVGHSTGGLIVRQYTSRHPRRVAGLVLVDAIPETMERILPTSSWNAYNANYLTAPPAPLADYADLEYVDFRQSFAQMRRAGVRPPRRIPFIVLSKGQSFGIPGRLGRQVDAAWNRGQRYLASLQAGTPRIVAPNSGHYIQLEDPKLVIDSVRRVIRAVRAGRLSRAEQRRRR
jgi:pimeloyl-ACP methyl ester carboxylesterase